MRGRIAKRKQERKQEKTNEGVIIMAYGHGKNDKMIIIGIGVALLFIAVVMLTTSTQSSSETITSVVNNPVSTLPNGEETVETAGTGEMTNIIPRAETEIEHSKKTQDVEGIVIDELGEAYGTININQVPTTIWMDDSMSQGVAINGYAINEQGDVELDLENMGTETIHLRIGAVFPSSTRFNPQGPEHHIGAGYTRKAVVTLSNGELPNRIVVQIRQ